ncbi:MAG: redox-regulated ATPase YchF [Anaerolineales bacterium]|nr:redox-regulated ATPase YchF [Anaerolineales bacterium]
MRLGIIGLPQSGKTTIFNALTGGKRPATSSRGRFEIHTAVVDVPDDRLEALSNHFKPEKTIHAKVTYGDIAGLDVGSSTDLPGSLINQLAQMDGFLHVVRCFEDEGFPHTMGSVDPQRDMDAMDAELLLNDLIAVERKRERLIDERRKGGGRDKAEIEREKALFDTLHQQLSSEIPLRDMDFSADDLKILSGYGLLTLKPVLIVLNLGEEQSAPDVEFRHRKGAVVDIKGKLEMEIAQLPPDEASIFLQEYGISEPSLKRVIRLSYELLGLLTFFTIGSDEVRAWALPRGSTAHQAAGEVHTDLQKGFIRAEVITWEDLISLGSLGEARSKGRLRLEGKDYQVKDGEVIQVRFHI